MEKMTEREFMTTIVELAKTETIAAELGVYAEEAITKLDKANAARAAKVAAKKAEDKPILEKIYNDILKVEEDEFVTASMVGEMLEVSKQKATALLKALVAEDKATSKDVKVGKGRACKGYNKVA